MTNHTNGTSLDLISSILDIDHRLTTSVAEQVMRLPGYREATHLNAADLHIDRRDLRPSGPGNVSWNKTSRAGAYYV